MNAARCIDGQDKLFSGRRRAPIGRRGAAMGYWLWAIGEEEQQRNY